MELFNHKDFAAAVLDRDQWRLAAKTACALYELKEA
jgi:hypothetical protein